MRTNQESRRKSVHLSIAIFALLIGRISPLLISMACFAAFLFNLMILPKLTHHSLERTGDIEKGYAIGILMYPSVLFFISILFFKNQTLLAVGWGLMAFGDGFAGIIGKLFQGKYPTSWTWPWNPQKTMAGSLAFLVLGTFLTLALIYLLPEKSRLDLTFSVWFRIVFAAALVSAWVETLPGLVDDNLSVPLSASLTASLVLYLHSFSVVSPFVFAWKWYGLAVIMSFASVVVRKMTLSGALIGFLIAVALISGMGFEGFAYLAAFFFLGTFASQWGKKWKSQHGLAQEKGGKRSIRHAIANGGIAGLGGLLACYGFSELLVLAVAGSFAAATSDTMSSELGNLYGRKFHHILTWAPTPRGTDGGISAQGTLAGVAGSLIIALVFLGFGHSPLSAVIVFISGLTGNLVDSVLGATLQSRKYMTNDTVNFAMTLTGFLTAYGLGTFLL